MSNRRNDHHRENFQSPSDVFYMHAYHPIQAGSIDGTDTTPHDRGIKRALVAFRNKEMYDPKSDPKMIGKRELTLFVGNLSPTTSEDDLKKEMSSFGTVKALRIVRDIVTGASRKYAFVEYERYSDIWRAYRDGSNIVLNNSKLFIDWNRQRLMPGWIPRRLGGGLGGQKTSGQLRFGGRNRPFRAPLRDIPVEDLKQKGIPVPRKLQFLSIRDVPPLPECVAEGIRKEKEEIRIREHAARRRDKRDDLEHGSRDGNVETERPITKSRRH